MTRPLASASAAAGVDIQNRLASIEHQRMKSPDLIPTRRSLLSRLRDWDDQESWSDFFNTYWRLIFEVALKANLSDAEAQEVVQETVISAAKQMPGFRYDPARGTFKGWLLQITRRRIADQVRKRLQACGATGIHPVETLSSEHIESALDPAGCALEAIWDEEWKRHLFNAAAANIKKQVNPEHYQLFDLCVIQQWPVPRIRQTLGVSAGQVYLAKHRVSQLLKKEIKRLEAAETANGPARWERPQATGTKSAIRMSKPK